MPIQYGLTIENQKLINEKAKTGIPRSLGWYYPTIVSFLVVQIFIEILFLIALLHKCMVLAQMSSSSALAFSRFWAAA